MLGADPCAGHGTEPEFALDSLSGTVQHFHSYFSPRAGLWFTEWAKNGKQTDNTLCYVCIPWLHTLLSQGLFVVCLLPL